MLKEKIDKYTDKLKTKKPEYRRPLLALPAGMNSSYLEAAQTSRDRRLKHNHTEGLECQGHSGLRPFQAQLH